MKALFAIVALLLSNFLGAFAQSPSWQWGIRGGSNALKEYDFISDVTTDPNNNVYILSIARKANGGSSTLDIAGNPIIGIGAQDVILSSFTCTGTYRWSKVFGNKGGGDGPYGVKADTLGGIYLTMGLNNYNDSVFISTDTVITTTSAKRMYLIKYDTAGNYKWLVRPQSDTTRLGDNSRPAGLEVDGGGNVYWFTHLAPNSYHNGAYQVSNYSLSVLKYNKSGVFQGGVSLDVVVTAFPVYYTELFFARDHRNGRYYLSGDAYTSTTPFSFGNTSINKSMFIGAFSATGASLWTKQNVSTNAFSSALSLDTSGNLYMAGTARVGDSFAGSAAYTNYSPNAVTVSLAMSLDSNGNLRWLKQSNNKYSVSRNHSTYKNGQLFLAGLFYESLSWPGLPDTVRKAGNLGNGDAGVYTTRFDAATGQALSIDSLVSPNQTNMYVDRVSADPKGNIYIAGQFFSQIKIAGTTLNSASGQWTDFFLAKYGYANCNCMPPTAAISQSNFNNAGRSVTFQYTGSLDGVDSVVWSWGNNFSPVRLTGAARNSTIPRFYGTDTGSYKVCVTAYTNGCGNSTACTTVHFTPLAVSQVNTGSSATLALAPNPATGATAITYSLAGNSGMLEVYDLTGRLLFQRVLAEKKSSINLSLDDYSAGVYLIVLREKGSAIQHRQLVVE